MKFNSCWNSSFSIKRKKISVCVLLLPLVFIVMLIHDSYRLSVIKNIQSQEVSFLCHWHSGLWQSRHGKNMYFAMFYFCHKAINKSNCLLLSLTWSLQACRKVTRGDIYISLSHTLYYHLTAKYIVDRDFK